MMGNAKDPSLSKDESTTTVKLVEGIEDGGTENQIDVAIPESPDAEAIISEEGGDDSLDEDQQRAFESILAQIEGEDTEQKEPASTPSEETSENQAQHAVAPTKDKAADESDDIDYDIEEILTEIASSDDASHLSEAASDGSDTELAVVDASDHSTVNDDVVVHSKADTGSEQADRLHTATPAGQSEIIAQLDQRPQVKGPSGDPRSTEKTMPARIKDQRKPKPAKASKTTGGRQKKAILASVVAVLFLALAGYFYAIPQHMLASTPTTPDADAHPRKAAFETQSASQEPQPVAAVQGPSGQSRLKTAAESLDRLRTEIIGKQSEIAELRAYYQAGIDAEIQTIADRVRNAGNGEISLQSAITDPGLSLGLSAIQRRDTYIKKLETPVRILDQSSEALLFFSRKAALLALMAAKTSDIDIDGFIEQADEIRVMHGHNLSQLNIDTVPASSRTLASIWQDIEKRLSTTPVKTENDNRVTNITDNPTIWKNICDGDFSQKHILTALSPDAARCLTRWKGKDLFLNALTTLSPDAARHLAAWEGDWLGLNGLKELSPETAAHLARWKGKGISLNRLSRLSPRVVAILSDWQGDQIELINVKHMALWENPKTRLFLSEDLKRKLNVARK